MRKFLFSLSALFLFALLPATTLAQENVTTVVNSGDDAVVESSSTQSTTVNVSNNNVANISQSTWAEANTGNNTSNGNISLEGQGTSINTGNALVDLEQSINANSNQTAIELNNESTNSSLTDVVNTGDNADINTNTKTKTEVQVSNNNVANLHQGIMTSAKSGDNNANDNIGGADINTGSASVMADQSVNVNNNKTWIGIGNGNDMGQVNAVSVANTGDNLKIQAMSKVKSQVSVYNNNYVNTWQHMFAFSNSGKNTTNDNIGGANISTGTALVLANMNVNANSNQTGIGGLTNALAISPFSMFDIVNTGDDLDFYGNNYSVLEVGIDNNNHLNTFQVNKVKSNSGYNKSNDNIGLINLMSGGAGIGTDISTNGNANQTMFGNLMDMIFSMWN